ncbi:WYL domain-containing protein [Desulfococcaceae bacterium HSG8]|nr:WYL domain-containing protein [Desulfococcaceae bacterium HSG8]
MKLDTPEKYLSRYEYIETQLCWGDGITAGELAKTFYISRQAAQKVIDDYRRLHPGQMEYNRYLKRHVATGSFEPVFIRDNPLFFLDYLRGQSLAGYYRLEQDWSDLEVTDIDRLLKPSLKSEPIKTVLSALRRQKVVNIDYRKKDSEFDSITARAISPNHLVFADSRYHIRAYCHLRNYFLDFVLSRILYAEISEDIEWVSSRDDNGWKESVSLYFKPNPELHESVQEAILRNYENADEPEFRVIKCKKSLSFYIERKLCETDDPKYKMPLWIIVKSE